jgi:hypothetical protein
MIRFDGYYVYEARLFQERMEWEPWYLFKAFLFLNNGKLVVTTKYSRQKTSIIFDRDDFKADNSTHCYYTEGELLYYVYKCEKNGDRFYFDKISDEELIDRQTGKSMKFFRWSNKTE